MPRADATGAIDGLEVRVVDSDGKDSPDGQTGETAVRSPANFAGYWDDPAVTREAPRDGWLYSGDLARRDADGYLWFEGRKKEIVVRDGLNISPQEVEEAFYNHPAVLEVAVIGMPDPVGAGGERVLAFVSLRDGLVTDEQETERPCASTPGGLQNPREGSVSKRPAERHHRQSAAEGAEGSALRSGLDYGFGFGPWLESR